MSGYDYDFDRRGHLTITTPAGTCFLQGDEAAETYERLEAIEDDQVLQSTLAEYEHVCT